MSKEHFSEGFEFNGFRFGWKKKTLWRLPTIKDGREYSMRKVPLIQITDRIKGYRIIRQKKSIAQVRALTEVVNFEVNVSDCKQCR